MVNDNLLNKEMSLSKFNFPPNKNKGIVKYPPKNVFDNDSKNFNIVCCYFADNKDGIPILCIGVELPPDVQDKNLNWRNTRKDIKMFCEIDKKFEKYVNKYVGEYGRHFFDGGKVYLQFLNAETGASSQNQYLEWFFEEASKHGLDLRSKNDRQRLCREFILKSKIIEAEGNFFFLSGKKGAFKLIRKQI